MYGCYNRGGDFGRLRVTLDLNFAPDDHRRRLGGIGRNPMITVLTTQEATGTKPLSGFTGGLRVMYVGS